MPQTSPAYFSIKNFDRYQHYKHRNPPWLKLYYSLLDDHEFISLSPEHRGYLMMLFLVAGTQNNLIRNDPQYLMKVMRLSSEPDLTPLFQSGFLLASRKHRASSTLASCKQNAMSEESKDRVEKNPPSPLSGGFDSFWTTYPRKVGKADALKAWKKLNPDEALTATILSAIAKAKSSPDWLKDSGQYIPHASTWLNGKRWEDDLSTPTTQPSRTSRNLATLPDHDESAHAKAATPDLSATLTGPPPVT